MSRFIMARRPSATAQTIQTVGSVKTFHQQPEVVPEWRIFRDISNLPPSDVKRQKNQLSFRRAKTSAKRCENSPPAVATTSEKNRVRAGTGKVQKLKGLLPKVRRGGQRGKLQNALGEMALGKREEQECSLPPFGLNIVDDVEPMEFSDLKEQLTSIEDLSVSPESQDDDGAEEDGNDPLLMSEYSTDILRYFRSTEYKGVMPTSYLTGSRSVNSSTRAILVNWLVQVQLHLALAEETLHLTVALMDRFLAREPISLNLMQLLGVTCLFVASKYEERFAPEVEVLCMLTDYTYTHDDVLLMEQRILSVLEFDLFNPTSFMFLEGFLKIDDDQVTFHLANYLLGLALTDVSVLKYYPSERAAAALCLAFHMVHQSSGEDCYLLGKTGYTELQLVECMEVLAKLAIGAKKSRHQATREKFSSPSHGSVSCLPCLAEAEVV